MVINRHCLRRFISLKLYEKDKANDKSLQLDEIEGHATVFYAHGCIT